MDNDTVAVYRNETENLEVEVQADACEEYNPLDDEKWLRFLTIRNRRYRHGTDPLERNELDAEVAEADKNGAIVLPVSTATGATAMASATRCTRRSAATSVKCTVRRSAVSGDTSESSRFAGTPAHRAFRWAPSGSGCRRRRTAGGSERWRQAGAHCALSTFASYGPAQGPCDDDHPARLGAAVRSRTWGAIRPIELPLRPGDRLTLVTRSIHDAPNSLGTRFGAARIAATLLESSDTPEADLSNAIVDRAQRWTKRPGSPETTMTAITIEMLKTAASAPPTTPAPTAAAADAA